MKRPPPNDNLSYKNKVIRRDGPASQNLPQIQSPLVQNDSPLPQDLYPMKPPNQEVEKPKILPKHWNQEWIDEANSVIPLYGFTKGFPAFRSYLLVPKLMDTQYKPSQEMVYPSIMEMNIFYEFHSKSIYQKWRGFYKIGGGYGTISEYMGEVKEWIENPKKYNILYEYFNKNTYQRLNFFGMSSFEPTRQPAYFQDPINAPQVWKNMMMILFTAAFIENHLYYKQPIVKFSWKSAPYSVSTPTLKELKFAAPGFQGFVRDNTNTDEEIITALDGYGYTPLLFPFNPKKNAIRLVEKMREHGNITNFDSYLIYPNLDGFQSYENLIQFCILVYNEFWNKLKERVSAFKLNELNGKMEVIKKPNYPSIFQAMKNLSPIERFKTRWRATAAGTTFLDQFAAKFFHRPDPNAPWPPTIEELFQKEPSAEQGGVPSGVGRPTPPPTGNASVGYQPGISPTPTEIGNSGIDFTSLEAELVGFMLQNCPHRLKIPAIADFWHLSRESNQWVELFENQWNDYFEWCINNLNAKKSNPEKYIPPGEIFKDQDGKTIYHTIGTKEGEKEPLRNTYPDYGIMNIETGEPGVKYWRYLSVVAYFTDWYFGQELWDRITMIIKKVFQLIINALKAIIDFIIPELPGGLWGIGAILLIGGVILIGGGGYISQLGANLAGS